MEACWCGCGAEWPSSVESEYLWPVVDDPWAAEEVLYVDPFSIDPAYVEPAYVEPLYTEPVYQEPVYVEPAYVEPVVQEQIWVEPVAEVAAPVAEAATFIVGGPTAGFEPVAMSSEPAIAAPNVAIIGGPTPGVTTEITVATAPVPVASAANTAIIGGTPLSDYDVSSTEWDRGWDIFLNNRGVSSGDPIIDQILVNDMSTDMLRRIDISSSNTLTNMTNLSVPSNQFSYNSDGRLVQNSYYNQFKPLG